MTIKSPCNNISPLLLVINLGRHSVTHGAKQINGVMTQRRSFWKKRRASYQRAFIRRWNSNAIDRSKKITHAVKVFFCWWAMADEDLTWNNAFVYCANAAADFDQ